jgi:hypothetical protein
VFLTLGHGANFSSGSSQETEHQQGNNYYFIDPTINIMDDSCKQQTTNIFLLPQLFPNNYLMAKK